MYYAIISLFLEYVYILMFYKIMYPWHLNIYFWLFEYV